jgi:predicted PurR-regulated permease PerM
MASTLGSILAIIVCGGIGAVAAWLLVSALGWTGTAGAIAAAMIGMVLAAALFVAGVALRRPADKPK